jgi:hypothetical protein
LPNNDKITKNVKNLWKTCGKLFLKKTNQNKKNSSPVEEGRGEDKNPTKKLPSARREELLTNI